MLVLVKTIGLLVIIDALIILSSPHLYRQALRFIVTSKLLYVSGLLKLIAGLIFLISVTADPPPRVPSLITALGVIAAGSGLLLFGLGRENLSRLIDWLLERPGWILRLAGILAGLWGGLAVYAA